MGLQVTFQGFPDSDHQGDDIFEILDGGVLKVETTSFSVVEGGQCPRRATSRQECGEQSSMMDLAAVFGTG